MIVSPAMIMLKVITMIYLEVASNRAAEATSLGKCSCGKKKKRVVGTAR